MKLKKCEYCGKEYKPIRSSQKFCSKTCGQGPKKIEKENRTCKLDGCENKFQAYPKSKQIFCSRKCQCEWQKTAQLGEKNGNFGKRKPNMFKHTEEAKNKIREKVTNSWKQKDRMEKHLEFFNRHRLLDGSMDWMNDDFREKISQSNMKRIFEYNFKKGKFFNEKKNEYENYDSSWELKRMMELNRDNNVKTWTKRHKIVIKYFYNNRIRRHAPDFLIEMMDGTIIIEEIKGWVKNEEILKLKIIECIEYCKKNGYQYFINFYDEKTINKNKHIIEWVKRLN